MKCSSTAAGLAALFLAFHVLAAMPASAACVEPSPLAVPDGATASKDEMLDVYRDMRTYQSAAQGYLDCLDAETIANPDADIEVMLERMNAYNSTVEKIDEISRQVHRQLDVFNTR